MSINHDWRQLAFAALTDMLELHGVVVLAYPELEGRETIDQRRLLSWILLAESLLNGMN